MYERELKRRTVGINSTAITTTFTNLSPPSSQAFNSLDLGSQHYERNGRKIIVTALELRGSIKRDRAVGSVNFADPSIVRIVLFVDHATNGSSRTVSEMLDFNNAYGFQRDNVPVSWLEDITVEVDPHEGASDQDAVNIPFKIVCNDLNMLTTYSGSSGTISDIVDNSIQVMACSTGTTDKVVYYSRVLYYDDI